MHEHIHRGDSHHGGVKVIAGKAVRLEVVTDRLLHKLIAVVIANPLGGVDQEARGATGGVAQPVTMDTRTSFEGSPQSSAAIRYDQQFCAG